MNYATPRFLPLGGSTYWTETPKNAILFGYALSMLKGIPAYTEVHCDFYENRWWLAREESLRLEQHHVTEQLAPLVGVPACIL